jgi:hypothetical protein
MVAAGLGHVWVHGDDLHWRNNVQKSSWFTHGYSDGSGQYGTNRAIVITCSA